MLSNRSMKISRFLTYIHTYERAYTDSIEFYILCTEENRVESLLHFLNSIRLDFIHCEEIECHLVSNLYHLLTRV